jgi:hypothetical protein
MKWTVFGRYSLLQRLEASESCQRGLDDQWGMGWATHFYTVCAEEDIRSIPDKLNIMARFYQIE